MALYAAPVEGEHPDGPQPCSAAKTTASDGHQGYKRSRSRSPSKLHASKPDPGTSRPTALASLYTWHENEVGRAERLVPQQVEVRRAELRQDLIVEWEQRLARPTAWHAALAVVRPILKEWLEGRHGALSFRLTQVLTGHGCFGKFLCRIGREPTPECHHCGIWGNAAP
ncbi:hypothetical protein B5X24_HaOG201735 [Helicoverpa armigera]|nr:hypothetical protein B5X24_HaOG201735 [Helicoverpa armigera]